MTTPVVESHETGFFPGETADNNLLSYLESHRRQFPDRTALKWVPERELDGWDRDYHTDLAHDEIAYRDFHELVTRTAGGLRELGIEKGDCVIIFLPMSVQLYQSMLAVMQNGAIAVFLESWARRKHLGTSIEEVDPKAMISVDRAFELGLQVDEIAEIPLKISADGGGEDSPLIPLADVQTHEPRQDLEPVTGDHTALITYSTGSSGRPKGANRTHRFLSGQHRALDQCIPYRDDDIDLPAFPVFSLNNLAAGVSTVIPAIDVGSPTPDDPIILATQMRSCRTTCATLSPSMLRGVAEYCSKEDIEMSGLRRVVTGGAPITNDDLRGFKAIAPEAEIWVLYGSTEVEPIAHIEADDLLDPTHPPTEDDFGVNVGHFAEELDYKFIRIHPDNIELDDGTWEGWEVDDGEVGEIIVSGPHVCKSYYNNPKATRETKIIDDDGAVWHRTGDLGYLDDHGRVWLVGRVHNAIRRGDEWVFPVQAEIALKGLSFTDRVAFLGIPDDELGEKTYAAISLVDGADKADEHYREETRAILETDEIPVDGVEVMDDIPMDPRHQSKVEYDKLREQIVDGAQ